MSFNDIMKQPLPSKVEGAVTESVTEEPVVEEGLETPVEDGVTEEEIPVPVVNDDDIDLSDDVTEEELDAVDNVTGDDEEFTPEEDIEADRIINLAATPIILKSELGSDILQEFCNSEEYATAVDEGFLEDATLDMLLESVGD